MQKHLIWMSLMAAFCFQAAAQTDAAVRFDKKLQAWDGFGVNYVEVAQTRDYRKDPQEYGGFSTLSAGKRDEILALIFGEEGLKPGLLKMFLDPYHEGLSEGDKGKFDHRATTKWTLYFAQEGLKRNRARGADLSVITTLYGPPPWTTRQLFVRGRDLDPVHKEDVAGYMIGWVKFLRDEEKLPVKYVSLHNEGEDFGRWPVDGSWAGYDHHDYNLYWHNTQVSDFLRFMRPMMDRQGLKDVGLTPGETSTWARFAQWGYAWGIYNDPEAIANIGLITSHGFGDLRENSHLGTDLLRLKRPDLHAWTTSMSWGQMDVNFLELIREQIYEVKVNGVIPWAAVQTDTWIGGDPNPGTAFRVDGKGDYTVEPGYYWYKQVSRVGQPGMAVAEVESSSPDVRIMAFSSNGTRNPDGIVIFNVGAGGRDLALRVTGTKAQAFDAYTTDKKHLYRSLGVRTLRHGILDCAVGGGSVLTLVAKN